MKHKRYTNTKLTATPNEKTCANESPNTIPTLVDTVPRHAANIYCIKSVPVIASKCGDKYKNKAVDSRVLMKHTIAIMIDGRFGNVSLSVPLSRSCGSAAAVMVS